MSGKTSLTADRSPDTADGRSAASNPGAIFALAGASNMFAAAITNPVNVVKVRMQLDGALGTQPRAYLGLGRGLSKIWTEEGLKGLWRGTNAALLREASYSSIRMGAYEPFKQALGSKDTAHTPLWVKVTAGTCSGVIGSTVANPTDVVIIRMQAAIPVPRPAPTPGGPPVRHYRSTLHAFQSIWRHEGVRGFYRGLVPSVQRAALLNAAQVPSYDHTKHLLLNSGTLGEGVICHLVASMTAGLVTAVVISPVDLVKTRMMQQEVHACGRGALYSSSLDCFARTARAEGLSGLYKGFMPVWMRIGPHTIITFFVFEQMRKTLGIKPI